MASVRQVWTGRSAHLFGPGQLKEVGTRIVFERADSKEIVLQVRELQNVFLYGDIVVRSGCLHRFLESGITVAFNGSHRIQSYGLLFTPRTDRTWIRCLQIATALRPDESREIAHWIVLSRLRSQRELSRYLQRHGCSDASNFLRLIDTAESKLAEVQTISEMLGIEGMATAAWWSLFQVLVRPPFKFVKRERRPPRDPVNSLLSLSATFLCQRVSAAIQRQGFELNVGFLHQYRAGRPSLACDIMEALRADFIERWTLACVNQRRLRPLDFELTAENGCRLAKGRFSRVLSLWERYWLQMDGDHRLDILLDELGKRLKQTKLPDHPAEG